MTPTLQKLVKLMNGQLTVRSKPGTGSVFEFTLPVSVPEQMQDNNLACCGKIEMQPEDKKLNGMQVVLVDSNLVRQVLRSLSF